MDILIWVNTLFLIFAAVAEGIILYAVLQKVRKGNEVLSRSAEALARVERISLATLERLVPQQGSPV
ncbi:MAG: hypothetical protein HYY46_10795 [Deltaproteobacteria bacterium]|nr:hypothetical protein [Deltaproteobacteria bacterium]